MEVERLVEEYDIEVRFAPFLLDPSIPPEGKVRRRMTQPGDPPTHMEEMAAERGLTFARGRERTNNSHLALEAADFADEHGKAWEFHRPMFKAYFEDLADISDIDVVVDVGASAGLDADALRNALETRAHRDRVDQLIDWARQVGVTGVPTFIFNEKYGFVGAQDYSVFESMAQRVGAKPRA